MSGWWGSRLFQELQRVAHATLQRRWRGGMRWQAGLGPAPGWQCAVPAGLPARSHTAACAIQAALVPPGS